MIHTIKNGDLEISVSETGAELKSVIFCGEQRLWTGGEEWGSSAPVLFPYCGRTTLSVDGIAYPSLQHGFARRSEFVLWEKTQRRMTFLLVSNEQTRKYYPFDFEFFVTYEIADNALNISYNVKNIDYKTLWFACGGHESFLLTGPLDSYTLMFEKDEVFENLLYDEGLTGEKVRLGEGKILPMPAEFLQNSDSVIFSELNSRKVSLIDKEGKIVNEIFFDDFENLLLWRPGNANMICIEPWQNLPDDVDGKVYEFSEIIGTTELPAGHEKKFTRTIKYY